MSIQTRRLLPRLIFAGAKLPLLDGISKYFQPKNSRPHDSWGPGAAFRALQDGGCGAASSSTFRRRAVAAFGLVIHRPRAIRFGFVPTATDYRANCHGLSCQLPRTIVPTVTDYRGSCHGCCPSDRDDWFEPFLPSPQPHPATLLAAWPFSRLLGPWVKKSAAIIYRCGKI